MSLAFVSTVLQTLILRKLWVNSVWELWSDAQNSKSTRRWLLRSQVSNVGKNTPNHANPWFLSHHLRVYYLWTYHFRWTTFHIQSRVRVLHVGCFGMIWEDARKLLTPTWAITCRVIEFWLVLCSSSFHRDGNSSCGELLCIVILHFIVEHESWGRVSSNL